jgi:signal transduction histidine kinase
MIASIRGRLMLSHLVVIIVAMGLSGFVLLSLLESYFLQAMEDSLLAQARITAQALIPGAVAEAPLANEQNAAANTVQQRQLSNLALEAQNAAPQSPDVLLGDTSTTLSASLDLSYLTDASLQLNSQLDTRIRVLDAHGLVLIDSGQQDQGQDLSGDPLVVQALAGQQASRTDRDSRYQQAMHLALPVLVEDRLVGVVYLSQPLADMAAVVRDLRMRWLLATVVALFLSGVVGLVLSQAIARPVRRLTSAAGAVAQGDLDHQVPVGSRDELGRLSRAFNDMTARLRVARQVQTDFVANVSHELRTPLTAVKGTVETLRDGAVDDPEVRDHFLETVEAETDRLIRLVNDLLVLSRADSEALNLYREPVDLARLVAGTRRKLAPRAEERGLELVMETDPDLPLALADPDRIEQVLVNLLDNALKYSLPGGRVTVHVAGRGQGALQVQVRDEGIGIPAADLPRIGERFYRADRARSRAEGGSGLGLAIARALVEAHGGRLWLESEEGRGTVVTFSLPAALSD